LRWLVDEGVVLQLAVGADPDAGAHVRASADDAVFAENSTLPHLSQVPHLGALTEFRGVGDIS
jgi:hypothetical protein